MPLLDSKGLGRLRRVANPRDVWTSESGDFTPWLAENLDVLGDALGTSLTPISTEVQVGEFRLDIKAEDGDGRVVVIENQLERSDHSHLGQCLVYASGLDAATVVWVAPQIRDDFRRALEWLNERTDVGVRFFGVELSVVQIGEGGPRAPVFDVVARPNDWQKSVKGSADASGTAGAITSVNAQRQQFFIEVLQAVSSQEPNVRIPTPGRDNWLDFASGPFGRWSLAVGRDGQLRTECALQTGNPGVTKALFDELYGDRQVIAAAIPAELSWERLDNTKQCRIAAYRQLDLDDQSERSAALSWAVATFLAMYRALNARVRSRASELKRQALVADDASIAAAHDAGAME